MITMKKFAISVILALIAFPAFCQESEDYPVRTFETSILIDNQTVATPFKGMLEFEIHHRFGTVNNALDDLFGLQAGLTHEFIGVGAGFAENIPLLVFPKLFFLLDSLTQP